MPRYSGHFFDMKLHAIDTGLFKLDGGAMFGVVPKTMWNKLNTADENNLCTWAMRCLLVEDGNKLILVDTGIGDKQSEKFFSHYHLHGDDSLKKSIKKLGYTFDDITDVVLTHLHFDHVGGAVAFNEKKDGYRPVFKNAIYHSNEVHWHAAIKPNAREKASFLKENFSPLLESGQLNFLKEGSKLGTSMEFIFVNGHTDAQMLPLITVGDKKVLYCADLAPSIHHLKPAWVLAYDIRPLDTMRERELYFNRAVDENWILMFEHDAYNECATVKRTEKGVEIDQLFKVSDI